jgi:HEAT repeat protein
MKNDPVEKALAALDGADPATPKSGSKDGRDLLLSGLRGKYALVAAKAARIIGNAAAIELAPDLEKSLLARLDQPAASDKGCSAKLAIVRALVQLEYNAPALYERGLRYIQMEASWGPPVDAAAEFRAACAMGLVNGTHPDKLRVLLPLLLDKEWQARSGAVHALGVEGSEAALLLLRFKALTGDENPDVTYECFAALLAAERSQAIPFVDSFCDSRSEEVAEAAMLALGASRQAEAINILQRRFEQRRNPRLVKSLLFAIAGSRAEQARSWLEIIAGGEGPEAVAARDAIESCWPGAKPITS